MECVKNLQRSMCRNSYGYFLAYKEDDCIKCRASNYYPSQIEVLAAGDLPQPLDPKCIDCPYHSKKED